MESVMKLTIAILIAGATMVAASAQAQMVELAADLSGQFVVPAVASPAAGSAALRLDQRGRQLSWLVNWSGLTAQATNIYFHGPAGRGENGPAIISAGVAQTQAGQVSGTTTLTQAQVRDVLAGRWYVIVYTPTQPSGEIRGQVMRR
jgi:hypothetical protein